MKKNNSFLDYIIFLYTQKKIIFWVTFFTSIIIFLIMLISVKLNPVFSFLPNKYCAKSIVKINSNDNSNNVANLINMSEMGSVAGLLGMQNGDTSNIAWAIELSESRTVLDKLSNEFNLQKIYSNKSKYPVINTRKTILKNLIIEENKDTGGLIVKYIDIDKELAANIVNKLVEILEEAFVKIDLANNKDNVQVIFEKINSKEELIKKLVNDLMAFQARNNILEPYVMSSELTKKIMSLRSSVNLKESELEFLKENYSLNSPKVLNKELEIEAAKKLLFNLEEGKGSADLPSVSEMPAILIEYEKQKTYIDAQRKIYTSLLQEYELLRLKQTGTTATFQVIEKAEVPLIKSGPSRGKICIIVTFIGFFFSIVLAFLKEFWINLKNDPEVMKKLKGE